MTSMSLPETIRVSLRESRMVTERLCQVIGIKDGILPSLTNCAVYSAALDLAGFSGMERQLDLLGDVAPERMSGIEANGVIHFDAAGQHAWVAAEPALDLLVTRYRVNGDDQLVVANALEPSELAVMQALAEKHGLRAHVQMARDGSAAVRLSDRSLAEVTVLDRIVREGLTVERSLWFHLFHRSHDALAPDSVLSRTHTGSIIVRPDGTIIGKEDPEFIDTDLSMLTRDALIHLEPTGSRAK